MRLQSVMFRAGMAGRAHLWLSTQMCTHIETGNQQQVTYANDDNRRPTSTMLDDAEYILPLDSQRVSSPALRVTKFEVAQGL
jgi:hypothetical protein